MPYTAKQVRAAHAAIEGKKSGGMPKKFAREMIREMHGEHVKPPVRKKPEK